MAQLPRHQAQLSPMVRLMSYEVTEKVDYIGGEVLPGRCGHRAIVSGGEPD
jgi:hypothetical protein